MVSVKVKGCLTVRLTSRTDTKVGLSDLPMLSGKVGTQRIKVTPGITGLSFPSDHSDEKDWHLDVGSSHPGGEEATKGWAVRPLKRNVSWVQNVVRQFGSYLLRAQEICGELSLVREDRDGLTNGVPVVSSEARLDSYVRNR